MTSMGKRKAIRNIPVFIAVVLLCLTLLSAYPATGVLARYSTTGQSSDHARVARFSVNGSGELLTKTIEADLVPGGSQDVPLIIENNSEVAVECTVQVTNVTTNLPLTFSMKKDSVSDAYQDISAFKGQQLPGSHTDNYTLRIEWPKSDDGAADLERIGMVDYITVTITVAQID